MGNNSNNENSKKSKILTVTYGLLVVLVLIGASYALFDYSFLGNGNTISLDEIKIDFLESSNEVIGIDNAVPLSDDEGKSQSDTFDFQVRTKTGNDTGISYNLVIEKLEALSGYTLLNDNEVKVYLTDYDGNVIVPPTLVSDLNNYVLYTKTNLHSTSNYEYRDKYKLRVWIDDDVTGEGWTQSTKLQYDFKIGVESNQKAKTSNLSDSLVTLSNSNYIYDGSAKVPSVTVKYDGKTLTKDADYTVSYANNTNAGVGTVTITGKGSYTGTIIKKFIIEKAESVCSVTSISSMSYPKSTSGNVVYNCTGDGSLSVTSSDTSFMTVGSAGSTSASVTILKEGTGSINIERAEGTNYKKSKKVTKDISVGLSSYTVNVVVQNGIVDDSASKSVEYGKNVEFDIFNNEGTDYTSVTCTNGQTGVIESNKLKLSNVTKDTTCTVVYTERTYTITYATGSDSTATGLPATQTKRYTKSLTLSSTEPTSSTNEFLGWSKTSQATENDTWYDPANEYTINENMTLYAQWYDVDTLETEYTGFSRSVDFVTKSRTISPGSVAAWSTGSNTTSNATSGYKGLGVVSYSSSTSGVPLYSVKDVDSRDAHSYAYINAYSSALTPTFTAYNLQLLERTGSVTDGSVDDRILNIQNVKEACLSISSNDVYVRSLSTGDFSVSAKSAASKSVSNTLDGYTLMGNVGFNLQNGASSGANVSVVFIYGVTKDTIYVRNPYSSAAKLAGILQQLFIRNKSVGTATVPSYEDYPTVGQKRLSALKILQGTTGDYFDYNDVNVSEITKTGLTTQSGSVQAIWEVAVPSKRRMIGVTGYIAWNNGGSGCSHAMTQSAILTTINKTTATAYGKFSRLYRQSNTTSYYSTSISHSLQVLHID